MSCYQYRNTVFEYAIQENRRKPKLTEKHSLIQQESELFLLLLFLDPPTQRILEHTQFLLQQQIND